MVCYGAVLWLTNILQAVALRQRSVKVWCGHPAASKKPTGHCSVFRQWITKQIYNRIPVKVIGKSLESFSEVDLRRPYNLGWKRSRGDKTGREWKTDHSVIEAGRTCFHCCIFASCLQYCVISVINNKLLYRSGTRHPSTTNVLHMQKSVISQVHGGSCQRLIEDLKGTR